MTDDGLKDEVINDFLYGDGKMKPGWKTTEFWFAMVTAVAGIVLIVKGQSVEGAAMVAGATGLYSVSRGFAKKD